MKTVSPLPAEIRTSAPVITGRMPNLSISAAAKGAVSPNSTRFTPTADDTIPRDQPNSSSSGTINTPGAARNPAAPIKATNATAATIHAGCSRCVAG